MESSDKLLSNISTRVKKTDGKLFRKDGVYVRANRNVQLDVPAADDQPQVVTSKEHMSTKNMLSVEQNVVQIECDADVIGHSKPVPIQPQVTTPKEHTSNCPINVPSAGKSAAQSECQAAVTGHSKPLSFASMVLTLGAIDEVSTRFENTLYGYFISKRLAFPIVENYVKNAWEKYGIERVMLQNGFFFFQFATKEGMERVLENEPWLIRLVPIILNIWTPNARLKKDEITTVPIWVKLHNVPIVAYSEIRLSLITTHIGKPIMLDGYTSNMCVNSWGRNLYARALIEVSTKSALTDSMVVAIPFKNSSSHSMETINIEYEWKLPRCDTCKIFEHNDNQCPKKEQVANQNKELNQNKNLDYGFMEVTRRNGKGKLANKSRQVEGIRLNKPKPNYLYRLVSKTSNVTNEASTSHVSIPKTNPSPINNITNEKGGYVDVNPIKDPTTGMNKPEINIISTNNSFAALLETDEALDGPGDTWKTITSVLGNIGQDSDSEEVENIIIDQPTFMGGWNSDDVVVDIISQEDQECVEDIEVTDVNSSGLRYTWNQKPKGADGILKKINRIMANMEFNDIFVGSNLEADPFNPTIREDEAAYLQAFNDALLTEECFLKQKVKIEWLRMGDSNTAYFYKVVKSRASRNRIDSITTPSGTWIDGDQVLMTFIDHYMAFLRQKGDTHPFNSSDLFCNKLSDNVANHMIRAVSSQEVKFVMLFFYGK
ncbi:zinc knuckle CX2CX4HX4C containing protein [Tanacetum coccineum]